MTETEKKKNLFQPRGKAEVVKGSILAPQNAGLRLVLNVNNMAGEADSPLYPVFEKKWKQVKAEAKGWYNTRTGLGPNPYKLGSINTTAVQSDTWVIHMLCQDEEHKTSHEALTTCLKAVCKMAKYEKATVHVSTLLTQTLPGITDLLETELVEQGVSVYFYDGDESVQSSS